MTEEQAKTKWCPMVRAGREGANTTAAVNWPQDGGATVIHQEWAKCIGSGCMMWRWNKAYDSKNEVVIGPHGYCGLAGKPFPHVVPQ